MRWRGAVVAAGLATAALGPAAAVASAPPARSNLLVTAVEYRLGLSRASVPHGSVSIQLVDQGEDPHDLALRRIDAHGHLVGPQLALPLATPGGLTHRTLRLAPGVWKLWCTLPGHAKKGMRARLAVHSDSVRGQTP